MDSTHFQQATAAATMALTVSSTNPFPGPEDILALGIGAYAVVQAVLGVIDLLTENTANAKAANSETATSSEGRSGDAEKAEAPNGGAGGVSGETIEQIESGNADWVKVSAHPEPASKKGAREKGVSVQEVLENKATGERVIKHQVFDDKGKLVKTGYRAYYKPRAGDTN